jgi:transcriptional regulator with XRE-family HTH domain
MAWKEVNAEELAASLGINGSEAREKQKLMQLIVKIRKEGRVSQATLAKKVGVSQGRIAQIESGIGTSKVSFDVLLNLLRALGYDFKIVAKKSAA